MKSDNMTASQILEAYSFDLSAKFNLFRSHYGFAPVAGGLDYEVLHESQKKLSDAFFRHPTVVNLMDRVADWSEQCHMLKVKGLGK